MPGALVLAALLSVAAVTLVVGAARRPRTARAGDDALPPLGEQAAARASSRAALSLATALVVGVVALVLTSAQPGWLGLPLALGPGVAASAGLLVFRAVPAPPLPRPPLTSAALERREPWSYGPLRAFAVPAGAGALLVAGLLVAGALGNVDDRGLERSFALASADGSVAGSASPFPGWFYGGPLIAVTVLLLGCAWLALTRIASTAALPGVALEAADRQWRTSSTRVVSGLTTAALLGYAGATAALGGQAVHRVATALAGNGGGHAATAVVGTVVALLGLALVVAGAAVLGSTVLAAAEVRRLTRDALAPQPLGARP